MHKNVPLYALFLAAAMAVSLPAQAAAGQCDAADKLDGTIKFNGKALPVKALYVVELNDVAGLRTDKRMPAKSLLLQFGTEALPAAAIGSFEDTERLAVTGNFHLVTLQWWPPKPQEIDPKYLRPKETMAQFGSRRDPDAYDVSEVTLGADRACGRIRTLRSVSRDADMQGKQDGWEFDLRFSTPIRRDPPPQILTGAAAQGSEPVKAMLACLDKWNARDYAATRACSTDDRYANFEKYVASVGGMKQHLKIKDEEEKASGKPKPFDKSRIDKVLMFGPDKATIVVKLTARVANYDQNGKPTGVTEEVQLIPIRAERVGGVWRTNA